MSLTTGTRLGQYEVVGAIGAGGMGEVYRARDTRLNRDVAVKILPALFAADVERRARFEREAQVLAALNHPHIAQIYGVADSDGMPALVMELVEGSTLDDLIRAAAPRGVPIDEALAIARQIAEALETAHEQGIVHRDLKPQNVMVRADGTVKVLDFGLAKALEASAMRDAPKDSPTITSVSTQVGTLLGTAAYMAPEQIKGRPADRRADIWAFGVVLYELLAGSAAFAGDSTSEILARVLEREPDWSQIPASTPPAVVQLLRRTLVRDPKRRLQSIGDARVELEEAAHASTLPPHTTSPASAGVRLVPAWALLALGGAGLLVLGAVAGRWLRPPAAAAPAAIRAVIPLPDGLYLDGMGPPTLALSPDGRTLAFVARGASGPARLYVRPLDGEAAALVPGSDTVEGPFFSPDGRWVAFAVGVSVMGGMPAELRKYSLDTGLTQTIARLSDFFGGVWLADGRILFVNHQPTGLWVVDAGGGEPAPLVSKFVVDGKEGHRAIAWPALLPGGALLVTDWERSRVGHLAVLDLGTRRLTQLGLEGSGAQLLPGGYIAYGGPDAALMAVRFDAAERRAQGTPVALLTAVAFGRGRVPVFAFSPTGTFVYASGYLRWSRREPMRLVRASPDGAVSPLPFDPDLFYRGLSLSRDGSKLAIATWNAERWLFDIRRGSRIKLPGEAIADVSTIAWSPDGRRLAVTGPMAGKSTWGLVIESLEDHGRFQTLAEVREDEIKAAGWTPDGRLLVAFGARQDSGTTIRGFVQDGGEQTIATVPGQISTVRISPDGQWLAYDATTGGAFEVLVMRIDGKGPRTPVNSRGGDTPRWSHDGRRLFFQRDGAVLAVDVTLSSGELLFGLERRVVQWNAGRDFDVAPDGSLFGMEPVPDAARQTTVQLRTDWFAEVTRLVGR